MNNTITYKGYVGTISINEKTMKLEGKVISSRLRITYEGESVHEVVASFHQKIDTYIEQCEEIGVKPEQSFRGTFNIRVAPYTHQKIVEYAYKHDISLNTVINMAVRDFLKTHVD